MSALSDLLAAANTEQLTARGIARSARERGHTLNHDTVARYLRGDHGRPDETTLVAFADILDVSLAELRTAADLPAEMTAPYSPPAEASRLTRRQRLAVDEIIRAMLEPSQAVDARSPVADFGAPRGTGARRAARRGKAEPPVD